MRTQSEVDLKEKLFRECGLGDGENSLGDCWAQGYPLASLFAYRGPMRKLILDFKVKGSWQSGVLLARIFTEDPDVLNWAREGDYLMPVPSSLWGRWRGKHDLAYALTEALSHKLRIPILKAPHSKYFRVKKQSFLSRPQRLLAGLKTTIPLRGEDLLKVSGELKNDTNLHGADAPLVILIDDIVTSAKTLTALAEASRNMRFRFLTLASAYHKRSHRGSCL